MKDQSPFKIDIHSHFLPKELPSFKDKFGYGGFIELRYDKEKSCTHMHRDDGTFFRTIETNCIDAKARLRDLDEHNINIQVLSTVPVMFNYFTKPDDGEFLSRFLNDNLKEAVDFAPKRFIGLGTIPLQSADHAIRELERCKTECQFPGVQIGSHINDWNLNAKELNPFWEAAQDLEMSVLVHPWDMLGKDQIPEYWLPWLVGMPAETARAICYMIFGGVFEKFPKLKVCFAHGGGSFPMTVGRIQHGFDVRPDLCAVDNNNPPRDYIGKFYIDSIVHDPNALKYVVDLMGADKIMLGSDSPFPLGELSPGKLIENHTELDHSVKEQLLYKTASEWLGININDYQ
jgi:aminocarboxymuconate-semialdehyde decarboxylase